MSQEQAILIPDIGDFSEVEVIEVLIAVGDTVTAEQSILTLESDKASMEIPSPFAGVVTAVQAAPGDKVKQGVQVATVDTDAATAAAEESAEAAAPQAGEKLDVRVPDIGDFDGVEVIEVLIAPGDEVTAEQSILMLESDKASMEIPSPYTGTIETVKVSVGDQVSQNTLVATLHAGADTTPAQPESAPAKPATNPAPGSKPSTQAAPAATPAAPKTSPPAPIPAGQKPHASPSVRRFARELGADLSQINGSGNKGRILKDDVQAYIKQRLQKPAGSGAGLTVLEMPEIDFAQFGEIETQSLSRLKKLSGANLHRNWVNIPHVTQNDEADITELEAFRKSLKQEAEAQGVKLTFLPFLMKALATTLATYPTFNASLSGDSEQLILKRYCHIGVAVDTPDGLVVPVIRNVDQKGLLALAAELGDISNRARSKKLQADEMQGGTFTISSLGGIGGTSFTPIINAPEVAILGVSRSRKQPVDQNGEWVPRLMLPLSLSYDHRVNDGAAAARFCVHLSQVLADMRRVLL